MSAILPALQIYAQPRKTLTQQTGKKKNQKKILYFKGILFYEQYFFIYFSSFLFDFGFNRMVTSWDV